MNVRFINMLYQIIGAMGGGSHEARRARYNVLGRHVIGEAYGCDPILLKDSSFLASVLREGARKARATIVGDFVKKYDGGEGVSYVLVVKESHIAIHTWPEFGYAAIDVYTCGEMTDPWIAFDTIVSKLSPKSVTAMEIKRGILIMDTIVERTQTLVAE